jgi:hypothetical protein
MSILIIHNVETGEIIEREMTAKELADMEANQALAQQEKAFLAQKKLARLAVLEKLGLTADEIASL